MHSHMGVEPKIGGKPPKIIYFHRVFHYFHHPFLGGFPPIFGLTPICLMDALPPFLERCFLLLWKESDLGAIHGQQTYLDTWLVNWIPGWSTGYLVGQLDTWLVNWIPGWSIGYLVGQLDTWLVNWIPGWSFFLSITLPSLKLTYPLKIGAPWKGDSGIGNHTFLGANC